VVSDETMAPISNPEPMPVDVIKALGLDAELLGLGAELLGLVAGEMTELMSYTSARYVAQFIGNICPDLSKRRTKNGQEPKA
jgi:hypothetical protein